MHVTLSGVVLFLHISVAIAAFMAAAVMHAGLQMMARATDVAQMRSWATVMSRLEPLFPILALGLLGLGAWLVHLKHDEGIGWSSGWVITAVVTLVVVEAASGALLAPRAKAMLHRVAESPDGPVPADIAQMRLDPYVWHLAHIATVGFLGIVFVMAAKPSGPWAAAIAVVGCALGVALSEAQRRSLAAAGGGPTMPAQRKATESARTKSSA